MASAITFPEENTITYKFIDWPEWGEYAYQLAEKILADGRRFDRIIALATGGLTLSRAMKDYLDVPKISSLHISFYQSIATKTKTPVITQSVPTNLQGENILIFDDINDSGETMRTAKSYVEMHGADTITTATILQKPVTQFPSDYFVAETDEWIIFPDEIRETIAFLRAKWEKNGLQGSDIEERLKKIGFTGKHLQIVGSV